jgi:hypothetical protein
MDLIFDEFLIPSVTDKSFDLFNFVSGAAEKVTAIMNHYASV